MHICTYENKIQIIQKPEQSAHSLVLFAPPQLHLSKVKLLWQELTLTIWRSNLYLTSGKRLLPTPLLFIHNPPVLDVDAVQTSLLQHIYVDMCKGICAAHTHTSPFFQFGRNLSLILKCHTSHIITQKSLQCRSLQQSGSQHIPKASNTGNSLRRESKILLSQPHHWSLLWNYSLHLQTFNCYLAFGLIKFQIINPQVLDIHSAPRHFDRFS